MVPVEVEATSSAEADVEEELAKGEEPVLSPDGPGDGLGRGLGGEPPADANDRARVLIADRDLGDVHRGVAVQAIFKMGGEGGGVPVDIVLFHDHAFRVYTSFPSFVSLSIDGLWERDIYRLVIRNLLLKNRIASGNTDHRQMPFGRILRPQECPVWSWGRSGAPYWRVWIRF